MSKELINGIEVEEVVEAEVEKKGKFEGLKSIGKGIGIGAAVVFVVTVVSTVISVAIGGKDQPDDVVSEDYTNAMGDMTEPDSDDRVEVNLD